MNWIYIALGGMFIAKLIEGTRTNALIAEAQQLKQVTKKPIMLISSKPRQGFDVQLNPNNTITWQLPYANKAFAAIVSDSLEEIPYPKQAMAEWMRASDTVLVNTHSIFSPETWLDLRHHQIFMGQQTVPINPALNWSIAGGVGYFWYRRKKRLENETALPVERAVAQGFTASPKILPRLEEAEFENPDETAVYEERKALPPPKIETAPIISPDELAGNDFWSSAVKDPPVLKKQKLSDGVFFQQNMENKMTGKREKRIIPPDKGGPRGVTSILCSKPPCVNLNIGDDVQVSTQLSAPGIETVVFDPQNLPEEHNRQILSQLENKPADSATLFGVLDKISDPEERQSALQVAYENIKPGGKVMVKVDEPKKYLTDVKRIFPSARIKQGMITAVK